MKMKMRSLDMNELIIGDSDEMRNEWVIFVFWLKSLFWRFIDNVADADHIILNHIESMYAGLGMTLMINTESHW